MMVVIVFGDKYPEKVVGPFNNHRDAKAYLARRDYDGNSITGNWIKAQNHKEQVARIVTVQKPRAN